MTTQTPHLWTIFSHSSIFVGYLQLMKNNFSLHIVGLIVLLGFLTGCDQFDKPEKLPVYLDLAETKIVVNEAGTFKTELGVKDLWVDYGVDRLGVFRQPAVVPLLMNEDYDSIAVAGGIFQNGLSSSRVAYPFWRPIQIPINAEPLDTVPVRVTFNYYSDTVITFAFDERFEGASLSFEDVSTSSISTSLRASSTDVFMGNASGRVEFSPAQYDLNIISSDFISLPQSGPNDIYLEITYKNDVSFTAGLFYTTGVDLGEIPAGVFFNSNLEWNTVYIHLNDGVRGIPNNALFKPYIRASSLDNSTNTASSGVLYLDNIRIVHFK